ncbi:MBOAT family O-acyltransferase [Gluconacetobacter takamatsuzukensis]|uniref:Probable alginate O-acetylase AlgI n=1 Tax=Gluconacetobacter takamatsuzukensis TaxID=1286190 RepID=A0A7W4KBB0_9PROT|nr:MBOAT family protein [Gluconacetobacter takamatsuzukensis]MBB2203779.1 MBOAT family protein [Gluconacetobacter takamatsuzukensis]
MLFSTQAFLLGFLPPTLALFYLCAGNRTGRQAVLVGASLLFYASWDWRLVPALVALTLANWALGRAWAATGRRLWPIAGIVLNLATLLVFKYAHFLAENLAWAAGRPPPAWSLLLPLGISFFTFQKIAYHADLLRGARPVRGVLDFLEFVTFFPQLIAGPIVRHSEIVPQFGTDPRGPAMWENLSRGAMLLLLGLAKKAGLADTLALTCNPLFAHAAQGATPNLGEAWVAALTYTLEIFFDFSGYSDMAIGMALMFGLRLPFNFNVPYRATSLRAFWQRWHMTLSRFLRDYLYIPLGGNRHGMPRQMAGLMATMMLGGLWHGAGWTFVAWGALHGAGLAANHAWTRAGLRLPALAGWAATMLFVIVGWVLFRAADFPTAGRILRGMAGLGGTGHAGIVDAAIFWIALAVALAGPSSQDAILRMLRPSPLVAVPAALAFVFLLLLIGGRIPDAFIYFQF